MMARDKKLHMFLVVWLLMYLNMQPDGIQWRGSGLEGPFPGCGLVNLRRIVTYGLNSFTFNSWITVKMPYDQVMWRRTGIKITTPLLLSHDMYRLLHTCIFVVAVWSFHSGTVNHSVHTMARCNAGELFHTSAKARLNQFNRASHYRLQL